jgi:hypothetical protein
MTKLQVPQSDDDCEVEDSDTVSDEPVFLKKKATGTKSINSGEEQIESELNALIA